jgi:hypothetical protein
MWYDSNLRRESRRRDRLRKAFLRTKTVSAEKQYKQQRNRVNNLKKQAKELFYANINENLDELKTTDSKMYWKTIHMLIKNERSANTMPPLRDRDNNFNLSYDCFEKAGIRLRDSRRKFESNHILSSVRIVTSLVGIHSLAIVRKTLVKFKDRLRKTFLGTKKSLKIPKG